MSLVFRATKEVGIRLDGLRAHLHENHDGTWTWNVTAHTAPGDMCIASGKSAHLTAARREVRKVEAIYDDATPKRNKAHRARSAYEAWHKRSPGT